MSTDVRDSEVAWDEAPSGPARPNPLLITLIAVAVAIALVLAGLIGHLVNQPSSDSSVMATSASVDAGFARDMSTHHQQAITMAGYTRDNTTDPAIKVLATDIETGQEFQVGEMQGWLDTWGLSRNSPTPMSWMVGHSLEPDGLMPGLATPAQMARLESSHGKALDILFLQLMIHHHQGGVVMAKYAADNAKISYVRDLAGSMYTTQSNEIVQMGQLLLKLGGSQLPPPSD
ncbi:DUF305 domain-containing protein [Jatrophihabitans sp.]|uniref:DUF305 domain-containing protein n=1 Tax=Jatrophihabitans sp. TaxID=1932789 RepID=UPI0030C761BA|nr:hypothetical protein [Jatrophihabitans sp.]